MYLSSTAQSRQFNGHPYVTLTALPFYFPSLLPTFLYVLSIFPYFWYSLPISCPDPKPDLSEIPGFYFRVHTLRSLDTFSHSLTYFLSLPATRFFGNSRFFLSILEPLPIFRTSQFSPRGFPLSIQWFHGHPTSFYLENLSHFYFHEFLSALVFSSSI